MTTFDVETEIDAPIEYVFEWGITPENWERSTPSLTGVELLEETDDGARYRSSMKVLGRTMVSEELFEVDEANYRTISTFIDEDISGEMQFDYSETETGTHVRLHGNMETGDSIVDRALQPVLRRYMNRQFKNTLETMKELIEAEHSLTVTA